MSPFFVEKTCFVRKNNVFLTKNGYQIGDHFKYCVEQLIGNLSIFRIIFLYHAIFFVGLFFKIEMNFLKSR